SKCIKTEKTSENINTAYPKDELQTNQNEEMIDNLITKDNKYKEMLTKSVIMLKQIKVEDE
ncbi:2960_t:CDS:1, partial [Cetraspora pellucida]